MTGVQTCGRPISTRLKVVSLAAGDNASLLAEQVVRYRPEVVAMASGEGVDRLRPQCGVDPPTLAGTGTAGLRSVQRGVGEAGRSGGSPQQEKKNTRTSATSPTNSEN